MAVGDDDEVLRVAGDQGKFGQLLIGPLAGGHVMKSTDHPSGVQPGD